MWDPYSVGSLLYRDPVLGDSAVWGPCCAETLLCGYSAVQGFSSGGGRALYRDLASGGPCCVWVPCLGGSWSAETLLCGESCVGPYSGKTMLYRTPALRGPGV